MARATVAAAGAGVIAVALLASSCTAPARPDGRWTTTPTASATASATPTTDPVLAAELRAPDAATTVLATDDPVALAVATSRALYASAPVAVVARADDPAGLRRATSAAVALGAPLLLDGATGPAGASSEGTAAAGAAADGDPTGDELARLGVAAVLTVGAAEVEAPRDATVVEAPADDAALADLLQVPLAPADPAAAPDAPAVDVATVAALDRDAPALLGTPGAVAPAPPAGTPTPSAPPASTPPASTPPASTPQPSTAGTPSPASSPEPDLGHLLDEAGGTATPSRTPAPATTPSARTTPAPGPDAPTLPATRLAAAPAGALVLSSGDAGQVAAVATARAAGATVVTVAGGDPRVDPADVQAVAAAAPRATVALGTTFGTPESLGWKVATAATGVELPGGGQTILPNRRMVAMYGSPSFPALGILGEQDLPSSIARAQGLAAQYQPLTTDRVVPAFEIIVTIASSGAGDDGNYSNELPVDMFVPWVESARDAGVYVVLDLQPGRTDFLTQARQYERLLEYPNVGLALDPEWRLAPDQVHLRQIGSVGVDEVNAVVAYLADLTRQRHLPQKLFVLHQFQLRMIAGRERLDTSREELATVIHVDGQGSQPAKAGTWAALQQGAPAGVVWGWKNFIDEDVPMLTPDQTYAVQPPPFLVSYQ